MQSVVFGLDRFLAADIDGDVQFVVVRCMVFQFGITNESWLGQKPRMAVLEEKDLPELLPKRNAHSNKGT